MPIRKVKDLKLEYNGKKAEKRVEIFTDKNQTSIEIELKKYPDVMKIDGKLAIRKDVMENPLSISSFDPENPICPEGTEKVQVCLLYTSPSPRDLSTSRMPSSA